MDYRVHSRDGKGAARYFDHLDIDGDGSDEVVLEVMGERSMWLSTLTPAGRNLGGTVPGPMWACFYVFRAVNSLLGERSMGCSAKWFLVATLVGCDAFSGQEASGGADEPEASRASYPVQLVDAAGTRHTFEAAPRRIVSLVPSATEALLAMALANRLAGRTDYDRMPELAGLPSVGGGLQPNLEILVSLDLDLVIRFAGDSDLATAERLTELGIPHFAVQPDGIEDVLTIIGDLGRIMDGVRRRRPDAP